MIIKMCLFEYGYMCPVKLCLNEELMVIRIYIYGKANFWNNLKLTCFRKTEYVYQSIPRLRILGIYYILYDNVLN